MKRVAHDRRVHTNQRCTKGHGRGGRSVVAQASTGKHTAVRSGTLGEAATNAGNCGYHCLIRTAWVSCEEA